MSRAETESHQRLKRLAAAWALTTGYDALAEEVRLPRSPYRADLVAAQTRNVGAKITGGEPTIALFECKQARADLLKDSAEEAATGMRLAELHVRRVALEELLAVHRPDLRVGETLFPEFDRCDFSDLRHEGYHAVVAEIRRLKTRLYARTKFAKLTRWNVAHACYLVVEPGICDPADVPEAWGLLVREGDALSVTRQPLRLECADAWAVVAAIARSGTRELLRKWTCAAEPNLRGAQRHDHEPPGEQISASTEPD